jgi:tetratricopeptide (TPR) repeat protein
MSIISWAANLIRPDDGVGQFEYNDDHNETSPSIHRLYPKAQGNQIEERLRHADKMRDMKQWGSAAEAYRKVIDFTPNAASIHVQLGHALKESGDYAGAELAYRSAFAIEPSNPEIPLQLGHLFNRKGDIETGIKWYEMAASLDSDSTEIAHHLSNAKINFENSKSDQLILRGKIFMDSRRYEEAADLFNSAVQDHGRQDIFSLLGHALKESGNYKDAELAYLKHREYVAKAAPELLPDIEIQLGHLYKIQENYSDALSHYLEAKFLHNLLDHNDEPSKEILKEIKFCSKIMYPIFFDK